MGFVAPVFAEPSNTDDFPSDGYMQEDYTYTNAATSDNMDGVYSGTVNAVAEYDIIDYIVNAGQYLPADSETVITCPAGSFCPGISGNVQYNQTTPQGIQTCPTGYASSAAGASSDTQCYRTCDINNMGTSFTNIAHATAVSGNDYYGAGTDTCEPTACVNGWHLKEGLDLAEKLATHNPNNSGTNTYAYFGSTGGGGGVMPSSYYGLNQDEWAVSLNDLNNFGDIRGRSICSTETGDDQDQTWTNTTVFQNLTDERGMSGAINCYCNVTGYRENNTSEWQSVTSPWVFVTRNNGGPMNESECSSMCARHCAFDTKGGNNGLKFTNALLSTVEPSLATCEANTITINWSDASAADISANNAGTATYGEDVRTPVKAATKKGQTFRGWRFSAPEQTDLP